MSSSRSGSRRGSSSAPVEATAAPAHGTLAGAASAATLGIGTASSSSSSSSLVPPSTHSAAGIGDGAQGNFSPAPDSVSELSDELAQEGEGESEQPRGAGQERRGGGYPPPPPRPSPRVGPWS